MTSTGIYIESTTAHFIAYYSNEMYFILLVEFIAYPL